jgi:hypothetical protein
MFSTVARHAPSPMRISMGAQGIPKQVGGGELGHIHGQMPTVWQIMVPLDNLKCN